VHWSARPGLRQQQQQPAASSSGTVQDLSCLKRWLEKNGHHLEVLQLKLQVIQFHEHDEAASLTALPCPQLQDLLLTARFNIAGSVWIDIAAATKLTSVSLGPWQTQDQVAQVVSALTALPDLQQLTWHCWDYRATPDGSLLQHLTKLTALDLKGVTADTLEHVALLTRLEVLRLGGILGWAEDGYPGLQELQVLTRLELWEDFTEIPASVGQMTTLQQLEVWSAMPTALNKLSALTGLTKLQAQFLVPLWPESPSVQLPGLKHMEVLSGLGGIMAMPFLASCTQL